MSPKIVTVTLNPALDKTITVGRLKLGGLNRVDNVRVDPGGKGINVAKVLKQFDAEVVAAGLIGGFQGQLLLKYLKEKNISSKFVEVVGETRVNLKIIEEDTGDMTEINESGFNVMEDSINEFEKELSEILKDASYLILSGSLPPGVKSTAYKDYINLANEQGVKVILDADGEALWEGVKAVPFALKPNIHELEKLFGQKMEDDAAVIKAVRQLTDSGIAIVIVSMGADGALVIDKDEIYRVRPFPIIPASTVGAGDSMVAVLAYSLSKNMKLNDIARWVTTAGTITASKPGTQVCELDEVIQNVDRVLIEKL